MDITEKIWWIAIEGKSEGAYSYLDLEKDERITPKTYVWKEGWEQWKRIKEVEELKDIFQDRKKSEEIEVKPLPVEEEVSTTTSTSTRSIPPRIIFWIIAIILLIAYLWHFF